MHLEIAIAEFPSVPFGLVHKFWEYDKHVQTCVAGLIATGYATVGGGGV